MSLERVRVAVEANDIDGLIRLIDGLTSARDWDGMLDLRHRCREAGERGKQLWGVAHYANYRLALDAPAPIAARLVTEPRGRMLPGPLSEVVGARFTWAELVDHLPTAPERSVVAQERVIRGEDLRSSDADTTVLDVPMVLLPWESYVVASYRPAGGTFDPPDPPPMEVTDVAPDGTAVPGDEAADALADLGSEWQNRSNGRVEITTVAGSAAGAIAALGARRVEMVRITLPQAIATLGWLGASGGAYGIRRGAAAGRSLTWWALAALTGLEESWPVDPTELGRAADELAWFAWSDLVPTTGWTCHLAVEDPVDGLAWAIAAVDGA